jgi:ribose transport system substrate-binding protein
MRALLRRALAAALAVSGCGRERDHRLRIGVALPADTGAVVEDLRRGMAPAADSLQLELIVMTAGGDAARQAAQVDSLVVRGVAAVLVDPIEGGEDVIGAAIEQANRARVPVLTLVTPATRGTVVAHVASDDRMGGELAGWYVAQRLRGGGNVAILDQPDLPTVRDRVAGVRLVLGRSPNIRVVASPAVEPATREAAFRKTATLLAADQPVHAFVATSDDLALGALAAVQAVGKKDVIVVGFGATPDARAAIVNGTALVADVAPDHVTIGRYGLLVAASHLRGNRVMPLVPVRVRLVDRDSL